MKILISDNVGGFKPSKVLLQYLKEVFGKEVPPKFLIKHRHMPELIQAYELLGEAIDENHTLIGRGLCIVEIPRKRYRVVLRDSIEVVEMLKDFKKLFVKVK